MLLLHGAVPFVPRACPFKHAFAIVFLWRDTLQGNAQILHYQRAACASPRIAAIISLLCIYFSTHTHVHAHTHTLVHISLASCWCDLSFAAAAIKTSTLRPALLAAGFISSGLLVCHYLRPFGSSEQTNHGGQSTSACSEAVQERIGPKQEFVDVAVVEPAGVSTARCLGVFLEAPPYRIKTGCIQSL